MAGEDDPIDGNAAPPAPPGGSDAGSPALPVNIEDEVRTSFLDYSMSVIVSRALPDVRDGLKPVHRRILYAMHDEGLQPNRPYSKSAGVVGEVIKHYHPHGDAPIYEAMVRMAQPWSLRYMLVDGQGNFGSIDGDLAAAYRYTEARLRAIATELLRDIDRETVDFQPNFDGNKVEPRVLPARFPNLLANGSQGIAVGMATNVPPHNLGELVDAVGLVAKNPDCSVDELLEKIPGPDFPTGALICGREGIRQAYATGRGSITVRAKAAIEETKRGGKLIVVSEIPYLLNKSALEIRIADLVKEGLIDGVSDIRDESDRRGIRLVIELKKEAPEEVILNQLYKMTPMQTTFGVNLLALVGGRPRLLSLREAIQHFLDFRREVISRRAAYDLAQAEARAHILEGFAIALDQLDAVIAVIRAAADANQARAQLMAQFGLSERQSQAILDMRLRSLTALERQQVLDELAQVRATIDELRALLASDEKILAVILEELAEIKEKYADERRTQITDAVEGLEAEDLIVEEDMVVTVSHAGYVKRNPVTEYRAQRRGGKGLIGMQTKDEDFVEHLFVASTHSTVLFFTNRGRVYWKKVWELPQLGRAARGKALVNLLSLQPGETVQAALGIRDFAAQASNFIVLVTRRGTIKKTEVDAYSNPRRAGIIAINLNDDDELIAAKLTTGASEIILASKDGKAIRFPEDQVRGMGRNATGVRGMDLKDGDELVGMEILTPGATVLTVTENGFGKRTPLEDYRVQNRGGMGIITIRTSERNGKVIGIAQVVDDDQVMLITDAGQVLRCKVKSISTMGRATQGVRVMDLGAGEKLVAMARLAEDDTGAGES
ncbi:MAG TPA: DNA gyrase subunit A [Myxococcota bacterium]|nr:DNA gyrase subunit A [Myxococcota bacterium]